MRAVLFMCVFVYAVVGQDVNDMGNMPKYDQRYDYLDLDAVFTNKRLVRNYVDCLINAVRCTPEGKALKKLLPEALRTKCIRCTEQQKRTAVKVIKRLKYEYPNEWAKLSSRWDPTGDFTRYFEEFLAKEQFNTIPGSGSAIPTSSPLVPPRIPTIPSTIANPAPRPTEPTPPEPAVLNRFGDDGELMQGSPSLAVMTPRPMTPRPMTSRPMTPRPMTPRPMTQATTRPTTTMKPANTRPAPPRFGADGELMQSSPSLAGTTPRPMTRATTRPTTTMKPANIRPVPPRPTMTTSAAAASNTQPTRFPLVPVSDLPQPYSTAFTILDQIGKFTELITVIIKNKVKAFVGR